MRDILTDYKIFNINAKKLRGANFFENMLEYREDVMNRFKGTIKKPEQFTCPLCRGTGGKKFLKYKNYPLLECRKCRLVSPNINFELLGGKDVYDDKAYIKDTVREIVATYTYRKNTYAPERLRYIREKIKDMPENKISLLDVGCGPGYFISYLKDHKIKYKGLELANFLVRICRDKKLNVENADLENEKNYSYNIITMFDVIEHIGDPIKLFKTLNQKLVKGGYVLAYTPNIHSLAYFLMGGRQNTLLPFQHLCFFDKSSLKYLAQKTGFEIRSLEYYGLDITDYFCMKQYQDKIDYLKKLDNFIPVMQAIVDKEKLSNHIRVIFKKAN